MRLSDIAARCCEIAQRVDASGEWGELAETLREAAAEVERLSHREAAAEVERLSQRLYESTREVCRLTAENERLKEEARRLRLTPEERDAMRTASQLLFMRSVSEELSHNLDAILKRHGGIE